MQGYLVTLLMVVITAVRVILNQQATRGPPSSSTDSETDNDVWTLAVHELIIKPITSWLVSPNRCKIKPVPNTNIYTKHRP